MIESIFIAKEKGSPQIEVREIRLVAGKGIVGDRNFDRDRWPGQNITFIEAEEVDSFNKTYGRLITPGQTRRNIITRSVRLNDLVGKSFWVGEVQMYGVELCEPCRTLGTLLAAEGMLPHAIVKAWIHKAGLRANVVSSGTLRVGMRFTEFRSA
jgi:MOSC domain-containing protein YiiM